MLYHCSTHFPLNMKQGLIFLSIFIYTTVTAQLSDKEISDRKSGRFVDDTSYVYSLPYSSGERYLLVQGSNSKFSHKAELAHDFKMKTGTKVLAVRGGVVEASRGDSNKGGLKDEYLSEGNYIMIRHEDGSMAQYWHFMTDGVLVSSGDTVSQGQLIGYSGNTGYSAFPHLHIQLVDAAGKQILTRFRTKKGIGYLRPGNWYRSK